MHILIILLVTILSASCAFKQEVTNDKTSNLSKKPDHPASYIFENQEKWLELKKLMANDLISAQELGVIGCRGFDRNSVKLRLIQDVSYNILNQYYRWFTYQAKDGLCIENLTFDGGTGISFFLSLEDSRVLLSAGQGYHFNKLGLMPPKILSKRTIFWTINGTPCGGGSTKFYNDKSITSNACEETISYRYDNNRGTGID